MRLGSTPYDVGSMMKHVEVVGYLQHACTLYGVTVGVDLIHHVSGLFRLGILGLSSSFAKDEST